jgi:inorganic pyrophosphatase
MPDPVRVGPFAQKDHIWVVIETPAGSRTKYKWDEDARAYRAGRVLPLGMAFPFDFGFVPGTKAQDGDAIDAIVIADAPLVVGALVECRLLGAYKVEMSEKGKKSKIVRNDRLVAVPANSLRGKEWKKLADVGEQLERELEGFFETYVERQGRAYKLVDTVGAKAALALVKEAKQ